MVVRADACQYAMTSPALDDGSLGQPVEKGQLWLSNCDVSALSLRCHRADALARTEHKHRPVRGSMQVPAEEGTKWVSSGVMSGIYTRACCDAYWNCIGRWLPARESDRDAPLPRESKAVLWTTFCNTTALCCRMWEKHVVWIRVFSWFMDMAHASHMGLWCITLVVEQAAVMRGAVRNSEVSSTNKKDTQHYTTNLYSSTCGLLVRCTISQFSPIWFYNVLYMQKRMF